MSQPQADEDAPSSFAELPEAIVNILFENLALRDLLNAASTCTAWHRCLSVVWRGRCMARWSHWASPPPAQDADAAAWRATYTRRHKVDAEIMQLLIRDAPWPARRAATYSTILAHGVDALDVLAAAAQASSHSGLFIGTAHQAHMALLLVQGQLAAGRIQQLLAAEAGPAVAAAGSSGGGGDGAPGQSAAGTSATAGTGASAGGDGQDYVLEVALQLAQAFHPLSDMSAVRDAVSRLGDELDRRVRRAGARPGSRKALTLLNALLFGDPPADVDPAANCASGAAQAQGAGATAAAGSRTSAAPGSHCWSRVWPRNEALMGPPGLSTFAVPSDGFSGLGFSGCPAAYATVEGSCMDSVLALRSGLPITLAILHRAVGRRVGLDIELVNMPGHVVNKVWLSGGGSSGSDGAGPSPDAFVFVDAFAGVEMDAQGIRDLWARVAWGLPFPADELRQAQLLQGMSAAGVCRRMCANLCGLYSRCAAQDRAEAMWMVGTMALSGPLGFTLQLCPSLGLGTEEGPHPGPFRLTDQRLLSDTLSIAMPPASRLSLALTGARAGWEDAQRSEPQDHAGGELSTAEEMQYARLQAFIVRPDALHDLHLATLSGQPVATPARQCPPIGTPVRFPLQSGIVVWWQLTQEGSWRCNVLRKPRGIIVCTIPATILQPSEAAAAAPTSHRSLPATTAGPANPPWATASCLNTIQQAQKLLRSSWFEPGFSDSLARFLKGSGQWMVAPNAWGPFMEDVMGVSEGLGHAFDAVVYDAAQRQCFLVPNPFVRHMFPQG